MAPTLVEYRLNAVCPYYTMFPLDFPLGVLGNRTGTATVLDPFCGRGTSLFAARIAGQRSIGIDVSPVATAVAAAKLVSAEAAEVGSLARELVKGHAGADAPRGEFWSWAYEPQTLRELTALRAGLLSAGTDSSAAVLLRALTLGILHGPRNKGLPSYASNQMPRTFASKPDYSVRYWKEQGLRPSRVDLLDLVERRAAHTLSALPPSSPGRVICGDAKKTLEVLAAAGDQFDVVITSPPYFGMRTYVADQWLRHWFLGGPERPDYSGGGQLARFLNREGFTSALTEVWSALARCCAPGALLAVRFGAMPSAKIDPAELLATSLHNANAGWTIRQVSPLPPPKRQRRQAEQFAKAGPTVTEYDIFAELR